MDVLKNKTYKQYEKVSRYNNFPYYYHKLDKKWIYGTTTQLNDTTPYILYKVVKNDSWDSIALAAYNNPTYYWVICDFNRVQDPFTKPVEGSSIKIPVFSNIQFNM